MRFYGGLLIGGVVIGIVAWVLFPGAFTAGKTVKYTHLYCPGCELEMRFDAKRLGKKCPQCGVDGPNLVGAIGTGEDRIVHGGSGLGTIFAFAVICVIVLQALVFLRVYEQRRQHRRALAERQNIMVCRCPYCQRKISYHAAKSGTGVACPRCKTAFTLPGLQSEDVA